VAIFCNFHIVIDLNWARRLQLHGQMAHLPGFPLLFPTWGPAVRAVYRLDRLVFQAVLRGP